MPRKTTPCPCLSTRCHSVFKRGVSCTQGAQVEFQTLITTGLPLKLAREIVDADLALSVARVKFGAGFPTRGLTPPCEVSALCAGVNSCDQSNPSSATFSRLTTINI